MEGKYEKLHLANNFEALVLLAKKDCQKPKISKAVMNVLKKLAKKSQQNWLDQEENFIYLYRYLYIYKALLQQDKKFTEAYFGSEYEKMLMQYEQTKESLLERYAKQAAPAIKPAIEEVKPNFEDEPKKERVFCDEYIDCQKLVSALQEGRKILLIDARPDYDFMQSRFQDPNCINVPDQCIRAGLSAHALGKNLPDHIQKVWDSRDTFEGIVLFDWDTTSENISVTNLNKLLSAMVDWDLNCNYKEPPVVLTGGYLELLHTYPSKCTNPHVYLQQKNTELDELLDIDNIQYPGESDEKPLPRVPEPHPEFPDVGTIDDTGVLNKQNLIKENKEITLNRQNIISQLLNEENEWKKINEKLGVENDAANTTALENKDMMIRYEIVRLQKQLEQLNKKKDQIRRKIDVTFEYDPEEELKSEDLKEISVIEEDGFEKMKILETVADERNKALEMARASKPKLKDEGRSNHVDIVEPEKPVINRATKPVQTRVIKPKVAPLDSLTFGLIGLKNIRNTCYMNTVIQCLKSLPAIKRLFCRGSYASETIRHPAAIIHEMALLIRNLWSKSSRYLDPIEFYNKVGALEPVYKMGNHEDCMEFFLFLLNHLSEDCCYEVTQRAVMTPREKAWYNQFEGKHSVFIDYFYHQIRIRQHCTHCQQKTFKFEIESTFMLSVPEDDFTLEELMDEYMADFVIREYCCSKCKRPVKNHKEVCNKPKILVIVLKRYRQTVNNGLVSLTKIESKAHFPKTNFQFGSCAYKLYGIALHSGDMNFGHYTAAALTEKGWHEFNDESVRPININDDTLKVKACAFFYSMLND